MNNYDTLGAVYDEWFIENDKLFEAEYRAVLSLLDAGAEYKEIGVGTGIFAEKLGIREGVEPSEDMARFARKRGIRVIEGVAEKLPYPNASAEGLVMITVDPFLTDINAAFKEAYRALEEGGSFVIAFIDRATPLGAGYEEHKDESDFYRGATFRSHDEIRETAENAGFTYVRSVQTVFDLANAAQEVKDGHGEGVFAVAKFVKKR